MPDETNDVSLELLYYSDCASIEQRAALLEHLSDIDWGNDRLNAYVEPFQVANTEFLKQQPDSSVTTAQTFADTDPSPAKVLGDLEQTVAAFYSSGELPEYRPRRKCKPLLNCFYEPDCWFPILSKLYKYDTHCCL
jgi:hypothetical protein